MTLPAEWRARRIRRAVRAYAAERAGELDAGSGDVGAAQLRRLNAAWAESRARSPWARALQDRLGLPARFDDWEAFREAVPVQRKADIVAAVAAAQGRAAEPVSWRATGGTTAEPIRFPVFRSEERIAELDHWLGRSALGIDPADRLFLLWGHGHMFGTGLRGGLARARRVLADRALGYTRWSAYRMGQADFGLALDALMRSGAAYVIGYASALDRFAQVNASAAPKVHGLGLKAVIATAEGFPTADSRDRVEALFGCPVRMEYGSVETGPVACERIVGGYDVFFAHHRLERVAGGSGASEVLLTSLYPRAMPLMRYAVGDLVETGPGEDGLTGFARVIGRCNQAIRTAGGAEIHSEAFTHVLRDIAGLCAYQIVRGPAGVVRRIRYESDAELRPEVMAEIRRRLALVDATLAGTPIERAGRIERSIAGKSLMVVDEV